MLDFDKYFLMKSDQVPEYVKAKVDFFPKDADLESKEIGDGNLNYVFRVVDKNTGKSLIIKQAGERARISDDMVLSTDRGRIEADILKIQEKYAPDMVPTVYLYDETMSLIVMEDMIEHGMMRTELMNHNIFPNFAEGISTFMVNTLLSTTDIVMDHKEKKEAVKSFINPDLCEISEDLVYSEPYTNHNNRNNVFPPIQEFVEKELYNDEKLKLEVGKLKFEFMNNAQSLIHGDLHTGSVFINKEHFYVFDPEFAFYGPMGYDVGNVVANLFFAYCHTDATLNDEKKKEEFKTWIIDSIESTIDLFKEKFIAKYKEDVKDVMAKSEDFMNWYLDTVLSDTAGVAGLELIRRTVGMANVIDLTSIEDEEKRARAEKTVITLGKDFILNRDSFKTGADFVNSIKEAIKAHK